MWRGSCSVCVKFTRSRAVVVFASEIASHDCSRFTSSFHKRVASFSPFIQLVSELLSAFKGLGFHE